MKTKSQKILYIGFFSLPDKEAAANRVMNNAKAMREAGHGVFFVDEQKNCEEDILHTKHNIYGFPVWSTLRPNSWHGLLKKMTSIENYISVIEEIGNIDLVVAYNFPSICLMRLIKFCNANNISITADCTEWYSGKDYNFPMNILSAADSFLRMRIVQKKIDGIIGISSYLCSYYRKCKNVIFVPPLVDKCDFFWKQEGYRFNKKELNLVYTGNLAKSKEIFSPIIDAIEYSNNRESLVLRIVGASKEQFLSSMPDLKKRLIELEKNIIFCGKVSHEDAVRFLKSSDYLIFFRDNNRVNKAGFSTKFVEAISCGTSVIATDTGDLNKYFNKINCGFLISDGIKLREILDKDIDELKKKKDSFKESDIFDFRNYTATFGKWIEQLKMDKCSEI